MNAKVRSNDVLSASAAYVRPKCATTGGTVAVVLG